MGEVNIRKGNVEDLDQVLDLVKELAVFEKAENEVINTVHRMKEEGFGPEPAFDFFVAENGDKIVGMALYFFSYSTWKGRSLYLDDLIVTEKYRKKGIGDRLFQAVLEVAKEQQCGKMHWQVLDWNTPAINYYKKQGSVFDESWINCSINL